MLLDVLGHLQPAVLRIVLTPLYEWDVNMHRDQKRFNHSL